MQSPIFGNRDIEVPVVIEYVSTEKATNWTFKASYECDMYSLDITGEIPYKLNSVNLNLSYHLKTSPETSDKSSERWYTLFPKGESSATDMSSPFVIEGGDQLFPASTGYTSSDILQFVLNAPAISAASLGFTKKEDVNVSIAQIYRMICFGSTSAEFGNGYGYVNPHYYYYNDNKIDGVAGVYFDMTMPYYSFEFSGLSENHIKVMVNLSSLLNMRLVDHSWNDRQGIGGAIYYPLNTDLYKSLKFGIAKAFINYSTSGLDLELEPKDVAKGKDVTAFLTDTNVSQSLLVALMSLYSSDNDNIARLKNALQESEYKANTEQIVNVVSNLNDEIEKCNGFKFGFRFNNYLEVNDYTLEIYKGIWGDIGLIFNWF